MYTWTVFTVLSIPWALILLVALGAWLRWRREGHASPVGLASPVWWRK